MLNRVEEARFREVAYYRGRWFTREMAVPRLW